MDSIAIQWAKQTPNKVEYSTRNRHSQKRLTRKIAPTGQKQASRNIQYHPSETIRSDKQLLQDLSFTSIPTTNFPPKLGNSVATGIQENNDVQLCSVRAAIITFFIILLLIIAAAIAVGIVFATIKSQNSSGTGTNNTTNSFSTISTGLLTSSISIGSQTGAACSAYTTINDPTRNIAQTGLSNGCDNGPIFNTSNGGAWIRFIGTGGTKIPLTSAGVSHCGAFLSGWFNDTLPTTMNVITNTTVCFETYADECGWIVDISVVYCPGNYYVYFLPPVTVCSSRYCTV